MAAVVSPFAAWSNVVTQWLREQRRRGASQSYLDLWGTVLSGPHAVRWREASGIETTADISEDTLTDYQLALRAAGLAPASVHVYYRMLKTFARWCDRQGYPIGGGVLTMTGPKVPRRPRQTYNRDQQTTLSARARCPRDEFLFDFMLRTGLRLAEVCGVKLDDVRQTSDGFWFVHVLGKGEKWRDVPLDQGANRLSERMHRYITNVRPQSRQPWLFLTSRRYADGDYRRLTASGVQSIYKRLGAAAGLASVGPHRARHTFLTRVTVIEGRPIQEAQKVAGHSRIETTLGYLHDDIEDIARNWAEDSGRPHRD